MTDRNDKSREDEILDGLVDGAYVPEDTRCDHAIDDDELDDFPRRPRRDDLRELPDDPPRTVQGECHGDPPPGWDESDDMDPPLAYDLDAEDCDIEGLGPPLSRVGSRYAWDSERECRYLVDADDEEYES